MESDSGLLRWLKVPFLYNALQAAVAATALRRRLIQNHKMCAHHCPALYWFFCPPCHTAFSSLDDVKHLMAQYGFELLDVRPAPQGRMRGVIVLAHRVLETINRIGWAVDGVQVAFVDSAYLCVSENVTSP